MKLSTKIKRCWRSKTVGFNVGGIAALTYVHNSMPDVQQYLGAEAAFWLFLAVFLANIVLRFKTNAGLADK